MLRVQWDEAASLRTRVSGSEKLVLINYNTKYMKKLNRAIVNSEAYTIEFKLYCHAWGHTHDYDYRDGGTQLFLGLISV